MYARPIASSVLFLGLVACSGGTPASDLQVFDCGTADARVMCLQNCNLGCSETGCARTDIAQNETVILQFSDDVDPNTVGTNSIRFRTASGQLPVGEFFVNGNQVEFVPTLAIAGGQTFFGFESFETYTMTILGGDGTAGVLRSTTGKPFGKQLTCTLRATRGIVDPNGVSPIATLVVPPPPRWNDAPRDTSIVLEFNELIDATPFVSGAQSPITVRLRRTRQAVGGGLECNPLAQTQVLTIPPRLDFDAGRGVTIVTFDPSLDFPGSVCVEVLVTSAVADLSGRPAQPQTLVFRTEAAPVQEGRVDVAFDDPEDLDLPNSAGRVVAGEVQFAAIGGDGRHGPFRLDWCEPGTPPIVDGKRVFVCDCDDTVVPASDSSTGSAVAITDGRFFLSSLVVPSDVRLVFVGTSAPQLTVAGQIDVLGEIVVAGRSLTAMPGQSANAGQDGGLGGPFGGNGGKGGDRIVSLTVGAQEGNQGRAGQNVRVLGGHAYAATAAGTGGRGSTVFPASGLGADILMSASTGTSRAAVSASAGGGGGGTWLGALPGRVVSNTQAPAPGLLAAFGPQANGGTALQLFPLPALARSSQHFLVGGAGGGGAASNPAPAIQPALGFAPGAGGGGGGGAIALRAGDVLRCGPASRIDARGGSAASSVSTQGVALAQPAPGGGGGGGAIVLQSARTFELLGQLDVRGGDGGRFDRQSNGGQPPSGSRVVIEGGNGAAGFVRLEAPTAPAVADLGTVQPPAGSDNVGALLERDDLVGVRSRLFFTGQALGPAYLRYEIRAIVDGAAIVYSDDAAFGVPATTLTPVRALFQSVRVDPSTEEVLQVGPWRTQVRTVGNQQGIDTEGFNAVRFQLFADRTMANDVRIDSVVVVYAF